MKIILGAHQLSGDPDVIFLDHARFRVSRDLKSVYLPRLEFRMAAALVANIGRYVDYRDLTEHLYGDAVDGGALNVSNVLKKRIWEIRKKLLCMGITFSVHTGRGYEAHVA